jgi:hypothetical protein
MFIAGLPMYLSIRLFISQGYPYAYLYDDPRHYL